MGLKHEQLVTRIRQPRSRSKISRLENVRIRPAQAEILKALQVTAERRDRPMEDARGRWVDYDEDTGTRQAAYVDLEAGASFTPQRSDADAHFRPVSYTVSRASEAEAGGLVSDELIIDRRAEACGS